MPQPIFTTRELRAIETQHAAIEPGLMERAGAAAAGIALEMLTGRPLIIAGPGNNGGDAFVVARRLRETGHDPVVLFAADPQRLPADARQAHDAWRAVGGTCHTDFPAGRFGLIIDGLFGIGLTRTLDGQYAEWVARINADPAPVLALDIPSGLNADTGTTTGPCVRADRTATFIALKPGLLTADGPDHCGKIDLCNLGLELGSGSSGLCIAPELFRHCLKPRLTNSHKGSYGSVAIVGGAPGMAGAAVLAGRAALKLGAGRVYLGLLDPLPIDIGQPELMLRTPEDALVQATTIATGPGLGQSQPARQWLARCISLGLPLVIDADGLNLLAEYPKLYEPRSSAVPPAPTFLTPHPAEAARLLLNTTTQQVQMNRLSASLALAEKYQAYVALKGCGTIVATPDGRWFINTNGNPGLASAGSGDVLTGMLAALLAQGWPHLEALLAAVHLHGAAADLCVKEGGGPIGLTAGELIPAARRYLNRLVAD